MPACKTCSLPKVKVKKLNESLKSSSAVRVVGKCMLQLTTCQFSTQPCAFCKLMGKDPPTHLIEVLGGVCGGTPPKISENSAMSQQERIRQQYRGSRARRFYQKSPACQGICQTRNFHETGIKVIDRGLSSPAQAAS